MNIYANALQKVENGTKFYIDFKKRNLKVGNKYLIKGGEYDDELGIVTMSCEEALETIEDLYESFINSMPSERSDGKRQMYFKAPKAEEMDLESLIFGEQRDVAQFKLEAFVLMAILNGSLSWKSNRWFWKSNKFNNLIILKEWVA